MLGLGERRPGQGKKAGVQSHRLEGDPEGGGADHERHAGACQHRNPRAPHGGVERHVDSENDELRCAECRNDEQPAEGCVRGDRSACEAGDGALRR